ncbi:hypothetical protein LXA43DRAFT_501752 [Ganoderma leucocontextum]|nr:hypothetical protein LXA43DRAFT_501752 [Ganoderma leucocontextum]
MMTTLGPDVAIPKLSAVARIDTNTALRGRTHRWIALGLAIGLRACSRTPPKLAPMPYTEPSKDKTARRAPVPSTLVSRAHLDPSRPYMKLTSGPSMTPAESSFPT